MRTIYLKQTVSGYPIEVLCSCLEQGIHVLITGGSFTHVGAVTIAEKEKLDTLRRSGHFDHVISEQTAEKLSRDLALVVTVACGIHYDQVTKEDIEKIVETVSCMVSELEADLQKDESPVPVGK
jgi:hypothetical protein